MPLLTDRCADKIRGVLSCWDRVVVMGTIPDICYADAMARHLAKRGVRLFDFPKYAEPLRDEIRENAERIAREAGLKIDHNRRKDFRKEERIKEIVAQRGDLSGCSSISTDTTGSPPSRREQFHERRVDPGEQIYLPDFPRHHERAVRAGHGGGDFFMNFHFSQAIRKGEPPYLDVYRGVAMSIVGPLAYRSALNDSNALEVPDFRKKTVRQKYASDDWTPAPPHRRKTDPWPSVSGDVKPGKQALEQARADWRRVGYTGE